MLPDDSPSWEWDHIPQETGPDNFLRPNLKETILSWSWVAGVTEQVFHIPDFMVQDSDIYFLRLL